MDAKSYKLGRLFQIDDFVRSGHDAALVAALKTSPKVSRGPVDIRGIR